MTRLTPTATGSWRHLPTVETGLPPSPESRTVARGNMAGKPGLDPTELVCDRRSHHAASIKIRILQKKDSVPLLAHAGHGFSRHFRRYSNVRLATDHEERAVGSLLTGRVPA